VSPSVIPASDVLPVHQANAVTGEVPYWDAASATLWWIDIQGQRLLGHRPDGGRETVFNLPSMPGLLAGRRKGGLLLGLEDGLYAVSPEKGLGERLLAVEEDRPLNRINDGKPDSAGRLWFGTMDKTGQFLPTGTLYRLDADGTLHADRHPMRIPNGIEFSPDGRTMYVAETAERTLFRRAYDPATGSAGAWEPFVAVEPPHMPDGCCIDAEGAVWVSMIGAGRIERRLPDGTLDTVLELPVDRATMPILGGPDGRTMFITTQRRLMEAGRLASQPLAGDLLATRVNVPAAPVHLAAI
jgi:sugar lactone lactonase YvrE